MRGMGGIDWALPGSARPPHPLGAIATARKQNRSRFVKDGGLSV
jgi:hypothetical protein